MSKPLMIGTRGSQLALVQAEEVAATLRQHHPDLQVELQVISTKGDRILDVALSAVGDKGLFVKELEVALLNGEVDLAVHSGKDLPSELPEGLMLAAFPPREDPRDALVLPKASATPSLVPPPSSLDVLPYGAKVGTSSLRRACQLRALRPDLQLFDVRGNVNTRLRKLDSGEYNALVLATAGLKRLGFHDRISQAIPDDMLLPAVSQAALAIEARANDSETLAWLAVLDDPLTRVAVLAERAFLRRLEGGCQVPIAAYAQIVGPDQQQLYLRGLVGSLDGRTIVRGERIVPIADAEAVGTALAEELLECGAREILEEIRACEQPSVTGVTGGKTTNTLPLAGWRVVITRSEEQADNMSDQLRAAGAEPVFYPTITIAPPDDATPLADAVQRLLNGGYDWLILTSVNGVKAVYEHLSRLLPNGNANTPLIADPTFNLAVVGPATAAACSKLLGIQPAIMPDKFVAEALADALGDMTGKRVLIATADIARPVLQERLLEAGASVERITAYRTIPATGGADLPAMLNAGDIHAITFTSGSAVRYFAERVTADAFDSARQSIIACIGPITAKAASEVGLPATVVASTSTTEGLIQALVEWRTRKGVEV